MTDRLLKKKEIAAMFGTSPDVAASILAAHGVHAVDLGLGRYHGKRWLESAARQVMLDLHQAAQPKPKQPRSPRPKAPAMSLADMSSADVFNLTTCRCVQ